MRSSTFFSRRLIDKKARRPMGAPYLRKLRPTLNGISTFPSSMVSNTTQNLENISALPVSYSLPCPFLMINVELQNRVNLPAIFGASLQPPAQTQIMIASSFSSEQGICKVMCNQTTPSTRHELTIVTVTQVHHLVDALKHI
jgi:hypothetical protein